MRSRTDRPPLDLANPDSWPVLLNLTEIAQILDRGIGGIRKQLQARTFVPAPFSTYPYRWRREDVMRWLRNDKDSAPKRRKVA